MQFKKYSYLNFMNINMYDAYTQAYWKGSFFLTGLAFMEKALTAIKWLRMRDKAGVLLVWSEEY